MDFGRLVSGQDPNLTRQLAEQLMSNALFRDAAIKAAEDSKANTNTNSQQSSQTQASSGLDNLLGQLSTALNQASQTSDSEPTAPPSSTGTENLLLHPSVQQVLSQLSMEQALSVRVLLGQVPAETAQRAANLVNSLPPSTVNKVSAVLQNLSPEDLQRGVSFFQALFNPRGDNLFSQQNNGDLYLNASNSQNLSGADLNKFLQTAYYVMSSGSDVGKFLDESTNVLQKGDYDDFRRFLSVADMMMYKGEDMDAYLDFSHQVLEQSNHDFESNLFQLYMVVGYGGRMQDYIDIANNLQTTGAAGRNNLVDMTRIIVDFRDKQSFVPALIRAMANEANDGGDVRQFMDDYMEVNGMAHTGPDFSKFDRIERIDGDVMEITQGESAALFAQAVSTRDGLLPESVLYWSSKETGAMSNGSSYLDLSKLQAGTYHIAVKIGGYGLGTDTAIKTVVVKNADGTVPDTPPVQTGVTLPDAGKLKITVQPGSAGLRSDLYVQRNGGEPELVAENAQRGGGITLEQAYQSGDKLDFFIRTYRNGGSYDHGTNTHGGQFVQLTQTSPTSWELGFEDLPEDLADWDFDDVRVTIELLKIANGGGGQTEETGETGEAAGVVVGGGATAPAEAAPYTAAEATQITRDALASLAGGASAADVAASLNERYYRAVDAQVENNQDYAQLVSDAQDSAALKQALERILQDLTGEVPEPEAPATPPAETPAAQPPAEPETPAQAPPTPAEEAAQPPQPSNPAPPPIYVNNPYF